MLSVKGFYDGNRIKPLEKFDMPPNMEVIITFTENKLNLSTWEDCKATEDLLSLCGAWEDDRAADEIVKELYDSRG